jgi:hypothetical protein
MTPSHVFLIIVAAGAGVFVDALMLAALMLGVLAAAGYLRGLAARGK